MRGHWKRLMVLAVVAAVGLTVVAVAVGATRSQLAGRGAGAACGALMSDPEAAQAMSELRTEHRAEMQAWYERYGSSRSSAEARRVLRKLRAEHWSDMQALFGEYGVKAPGTGRSTAAAAAVVEASGAGAAAPALRARATA